MKKFNEVLERRISLKADQTEDQFYREFEQLLNKYGLSRSVIFHGLEGVYEKPEDKRDEWRDRVKEVFIGKETEKFLSELNRLEGYFNNNGQY